MRVSSLVLLNPDNMVHQNELYLYSPEMQLLYQRFGRGFTPTQFVKVWTTHVNPQAESVAHAPFSVDVYTRHPMARPRSIRINPNLRNWWDRFLYDIRRVFGSVLGETEYRARLLLNGHPLEAFKLRALRDAPPYALQVHGDTNGVQLPEADPIQADLDRRRQEEARRRSELKEAEASNPHAANSVQAINVINAVIDEVSAGLADMSLRANQGGTSNKFRVIGDSLATYALASRAFNNPAHYKPHGYDSSRDFFERALGAKKAAEAIDSLAHEISSKAARAPSSMRNPTRETLKDMYSKRISGSLIAQWRDTVHRWLGQRPTTSSTGKYHLRGDYSLAVAEAGGRNTVSAAYRWKSRVDAAQAAAREATSHQLFESNQFLSRAEKTTIMLDRVADDQELMRTALSGRPIQSLASQMPTTVPGNSLPSGTSSIPESLPYAAAQEFDSMPRAIPWSAAKLPESMPTPIPYSEEASIALPVFSSMTNVERFKTRSLKEDPLAHELARDILNGDKYSGIVVPDLGADASKAIAGQLAARSAEERDDYKKPYQLIRGETSASINRLLNGSQVGEFPLVAANTGVWKMASDDQGAVTVRNIKTDQMVPAVITRIAERPEMVMIHVPIAHTEGMRKKV